MGLVTMCDVKYNVRTPFAKRTRYTRYNNKDEAIYMTTYVMKTITVGAYGE